MTTPTDADTDLLTVIASMRAATGKRSELRDALTALVEPTREEDGCATYVLHESIEEPGLFFFYEHWESAEHLDAHLDAPHVHEFAGRMEDLVDDDGATLSRVRRIA